MIDREVALLLLTLPQASHPSTPQGETLFSSLVGTILTRVKRHPASGKLLFLKYLEKGLLMAFPGISEAFQMALEFLEPLPTMNELIRMALHCGEVRIRSNGDVFGREVHRVYRMEGVRPQDQSSSIASLFQQNYLLITQQGLAQLSEHEQRSFTSAGIFQLEGLDETCELWILSSRNAAEKKV
jgi:class 3 adenylate cyclase